MVPYAEAEYLHTGLGSGVETGAGTLNLDYSAIQTDLIRLEAGLSTGMAVPVRYGILEPWISIGAAGSLGNNHVSDVERLGEITGVEAAIAAPASAVKTGAGVSLQGNGRWQLSAGWGGQFGDGTTLENLTVEARYVW
jgi:hypothetical protein